MNGQFREGGQGFLLEMSCEQTRKDESVSQK